MGFWNRLGNVAYGFGSAVQASVGLVKDLAIAPWTDDEQFDGFVNTVWTRGKVRAAQGLGNLFGPERGFGAAIGGQPEYVRAPVRWGLDALEFAYREGVAEPASTAFLMAAEEEGPQRFLAGGLPTAFRALTDPQKTLRAYQRAQSISPGQASYLLYYGADINNPAEVNAVVGTDAFKVTTGVTDAAYRLAADPAILVGKVATVARLRYVTQPIRSADDIAAIAAAPRFTKVIKEMDRMNAAEIRGRFFSTHDSGAGISTLLADAGDEATRARTMKILMGDTKELAPLAEKRAGFADQVARLLDEQQVINSLESRGIEIRNSSERLSELGNLIDDLHPQEQRLAHLEALAGTVRQAPRYRRMAGVREGIMRSDFIQKHPFAASVRRVMLSDRPQRVINLHDSTGDIQVARMLRKSDLPQEAQDSLRTRFMSSRNPGDRELALVAVEEAAVKSIAEKAGMSVDDIDSALSQARRYRAQSSSVLKSRVYDGKGRSIVRFEDDAGVAHELNLPVFITQEQNIATLVDLDRVRQVTSTIGRFKLRHPTTQIPVDLAESFHKLWKPAVLLRLGWPLRVVGDEQLRIMAKIGTLAQMKNLASAGKNYAVDALKGVPRGARGQRFFEVNGYQLQGAFGAPGDTQNVYRQLVRSDASFKQFFGDEEGRLLKELREQSGEWRSIAPVDKDYGRAFENALNNQIGRDPMGQQFLRGKTVDDVVEWFKTSDGQVYADRLSFRKDNTRKWAETARDIVEDYTVGSDELKALALGQKVTADDLARILPNAAERPMVHGEILAQTFWNSPTMQVLQGVTDKGLSALGSAPTNVLSRNRFFDAMYQAEVTRQVRLFDPQIAGRLDEVALRRVESNARNYALRETRYLLYDLAEQTELGHMLRFFAPFYNAWREVITRWSGLAIENPAFIARMRLVWNSPEKAGIVVDEKGAYVDEDGRGHDPLSNKPVLAGDERFITIRLPEWVQDIPGMSSAGSMQFNKKGFSLMLQGTPGFGPVVTIPVNEIVKERPDLEQSLEFILPFGTTQEIRDLFLPSTAKRLAALAGGEEDRAFRNSALRIYFDKVTDYELGKREVEPTWQEAVKEAQSFYKLRAVASWVMPAAPGFKSPYQPHIDAYRRLKEADPETADEKFLAQFGEEYFALTQSLSRSTDGIPPTLEGAKARKQYRDLIEKYPQLGGLIVGSDGAGEFVRSVYDAQLSTPVFAGSEEKQREAFSFEVASESPEKRLGWMKFRKLMDLIDAERVQRGLPSLQVKGAKDLAALKRQGIANLGKQYPAWFADFSVVDRNAQTRKIAGMRELVKDSRLSKRQDIEGLATYLRARDLIAKELATRGARGGAKTLTANSNQDLAQLWESMRGSLVERNLAFSDLMYRYLERDVPEAV